MAGMPNTTTSNNPHSHSLQSQPGSVAEPGSAAPSNASNARRCKSQPSRPDAVFRMHVLASGSRGNATVLETPDTCLLIDCGITKKAFLERCDAVEFDPTRIQAIIVTHEHSDHTSGLGVNLRGLRKLGCLPRIYTTQGTFDNSRELQAIASDFPVSPMAHDQALSLGTINVQFLPTSHDAADPVCMVFETVRKGCRDVAGYVTDTGVFPDGFGALVQDARLLALESNHDEDMLRQGPYPFALKQRIASASGHLSNDQSDNALASVLGNRLEAVIGMHLSETNNTPTLAYEGFQQVITRFGHPAHVYTGRQRTPVSIG